MRTCRAMFRPLCAALCCLFVGACSVAQVKDAGRQMGASALEQAFILVAFGSDALKEHNEDVRREWHEKNNPYRSSFTRETFLEWQERIDFENYHDELQGTERKYSPNRDSSILSCTIF